MKKQKTTILLIGLMLLTTFGVFIGLAQDDGDTSTGVNRAASGINCVLCRVANLIFLIVAALAAIVIILAGLKWLTSGDDPGARNAAKTAIVSAFVGIVIIFVAVFVVSWVMQGLGGVFDDVDVMTWIDPNACSTECDAARGEGGAGPETPTGPGG